MSKPTLRVLTALALCLALPAGAGPLSGPQARRAGGSHDPRVGDAHGANPFPSVSAPAERASQAWYERERLSGDWAGHRSRLEAWGFSAEATWISDWSGPLSGGIRDRDSFRFLHDLNAAFDLSKILGWQGATLFLDSYVQHGREASQDIGDFQGFSNIDSPNRIEIAEVWIEQRLFDEKLRIKLGKVDANSEFAFVDAAGDFLNSSAGFSPTLFVLPTYPDPAMSVNVFFYATPWFYAGAAIYDGAGGEGFATGKRGPKTFFGGDGSNASFLIGEVGWIWDGGPSSGPGRLAVGSWLYTGRVDRFQGGREGSSAGWFALVEHTVYRESPEDPADEQGIRVFAQYGWADEDVSEAGQHLSLGAAWTGPVPSRDEDSAGFMVSWVDLSDRAAAGFSGNETTFEVFYRWQLAPFLSVWGDFQYVKNPSGATDQRDTIVGTLRTEISF